MSRPFARPPVPAAAAPVSRIASPRRIASPCPTVRLARLVPAVVGVILVALVLATQSGCLGLVANLAHAVGADKVPAEYKGLSEQKVAIVTFSDASPFGEDRSARSLSDSITEILDREVKEIEIVRSEEIDDWRDRNGWDQADFLAIGKGVDATKVLAIELSGLRLREGPNLYRGHADVSLEVIDVATGAREYRKSLDDFTFPRNAAQDSGNMTESKFRRIYLGILARQVARLFHPYDLNEDFALDGKFASF